MWNDKQISPYSQLNSNHTAHKSDDDNGTLLGFERYKDFDDLSMDADAGQDNDDKLDSVDSNYDDKNLRMDYWIYDT